MPDLDTSTLTQSPKPAAPTRPKEEVARLGKDIYERDIRSKVEDAHHGEIVAIDVDSGHLGYRRHGLGRSGRPVGTASRPGRLGSAGGVSDAAHLRGQFSPESRMPDGFVNANHETVVSLSLQGPEGQTRESVYELGCLGDVMVLTRCKSESQWVANHPRLREPSR